MLERFPTSEKESALAPLFDLIERVTDAEKAEEDREMGQLVEDLILARASDPDPLFREIAAEVWTVLKDDLPKSIQPDNPVSPPSDNATTSFLAWADPKPSVANPVPPKDPSVSGAYSTDEIMKHRDVLRLRLSEQEYDGYMGSVLREGVRLARSISEVSKREAQALSGFARDWDVDLSSFWNKMAI
jgi:hypothetical protein